MLLMLLMFGVGVGWMLALGAVMALEKNLPGDSWLTRNLGTGLDIALIAGATLARAAGGWRTASWACLAMVLMAVTGQARAGWFDPHPPGPATPMVEGRSHLGPRAYHAMCAHEPKLCAADFRASNGMPGVPATMTERRWQQVLDLNERINDAIRPRDDTDAYGVSDYWTEGRGIGDCEDYIIAKKQALMRAGWRADQLLYAVVEGFRPEVVPLRWTAWQRS